MFETICDLIPRDADYPPRARALDILRRVLDGTLYDVLPYQFHEERGAGGEYIPLRNRRPSRALRALPHRGGGQRRPAVQRGPFPDDRLRRPHHSRAALADIVKEARLNQVMTEAAMRGAIGSVAILMRVLRGRVFFAVLDTTYLTPVWDPEAPDTLVTRHRAIQGRRAPLLAHRLRRSRTLRRLLVHAQLGRAGRDLVLPWPVGSRRSARRSTRRAASATASVSCRIVWVRNLPGLVRHRRSPTMAPAPSAPPSRRRSRSTTSSARPDAG